MGSQGRIGPFNFRENLRRLKMSCEFATYVRGLSSASGPGRNKKRKARPAPTHDPNKGVELPINALPEHNKQKLDKKNFAMPNRHLSSIALARSAVTFGFSSLSQVCNSGFLLSPACAFDLPDPRHDALILCFVFTFCLTSIYNLLVMTDHQVVQPSISVCSE